MDKRGGDSGLISWPWLGPVLVTICLGLIGMIYNRQVAQIKGLEDARSEDRVTIAVQKHDIDALNYKVNEVLRSLESINSKIDEMNMRWMRTYGTMRPEGPGLQRQFDK